MPLCTPNSRLGRTLLPALALFSAACDPTYVVGSWGCAASAPVSDAGQLPASDWVVPDAWQTGFEDGFCGFAAAHGYCYANPSAHYELVSSPVKSGRFALALSVDSAVPDYGALQARCVIGGNLPAAAYYSAWYWIPELHTNTDNWNLFHFEGIPAAPEPSHGLWDVSLVNTADGQLSLSVYNFLSGVRLNGSTAPAVPIGKWFQLQIYFKRSATADGEIAVYQDGVRAFRFTNVITDDTELGQWFVGNHANAIRPSRLTLFVDDIAVSDRL